MIKELIPVLPIVVAMLLYFLRLEVRLAKIVKDICWIKKLLEKHINAEA